MTRAALRPALLALAAAVALGLLGRVAVVAGTELPHGAALAGGGHALLALGAPWLAAAWVVGALAGSRAAGALAGGFALALGTAAWYALSVAHGGRAAVFYAFPVAPAWAVVALAAGALFGLAGAAWHDGGRLVRAAAVALPSGALAGEALLLSGEWAGRAHRAALTVELAVAGAVLVIAVHRRAWWPVALGLAAACAIVFAIGEGAVRDALRAAGWLGP